MPTSASARDKPAIRGEGGALTGGQGALLTFLESSRRADVKL